MFELNWYNEDDNLINFYHSFYITKENKRTHDLNEASYCIKGAWDHNLEYENIKNNLSFLKDCTVLDIGCQEGFFTFLLDDLGADVTSMDCYDKITRRFAWKLFNYKGEFVHENVYQLGSSYNTYDYAWLSDVLVHLENPLYALENIRKVVDRGVLVVMDEIPDITPMESVWGDYDKENKALPLMYQRDSDGKGEESTYFWLMPIETVISLLNRFFSNPRKIFSYKVGGRTANVFLAEIDSSFKERGFLELDWKRED